MFHGWDEGVLQLQKGQKAKLVCPSDYAYAENGIRKGLRCVVQPNATILFEIEVIDFEQDA